MNSANILLSTPETLNEHERALLARAHNVLHKLYGADAKMFKGLITDISRLVAKAKNARPPALKALDARRQSDPLWFAKPAKAAYCTYIDRFSNTLSGCVPHLSYLRALGIGLFHPLPLLRPREGDNDGGFAVADYGAVDPRLGTFDDLKELAAQLRAHDMSLVLDVVCNHTAREHGWAKAMLAGDPAFKDFYIVLKDEDEVKAWGASLSDVFPDTAPGSFTYDEGAKGWVWTTFYPYQWDLNYANPRVFMAMLEVLFTLANAGVEGFRLDSAAYLWKIKGTSCRNLAQAHDLLFAFRNLLSVVAPGTFLLAEAIEGLDEVVGYFGRDCDHSECDMAYNNTVMTALWGSLAEGNADAVTEALRLCQVKPAHGVWLNYVRCHDDIIWQALAPWVDQARLKAWSDHYGGKKGSFADGLAFQAPLGKALSTCGMAASLCGVGHDAYGLARLKLLYGVTYALDGVAMIYMGDEIALLNAPHFSDDPEKAAELRWLHRPKMDWQAARAIDDKTSPQGDIFAYLQSLAKAQAAGLSAEEILCPAIPVAGFDRRLLVLKRALKGGVFYGVANFGHESVPVPATLCGYDMITQTDVTTLGPYQCVWLRMTV
jgi:amylosucrase